MKLVIEISEPDLDSVLELASRMKSWVPMTPAEVLVKAVQDARERWIAAGRPPHDGG